MQLHRFDQMVSHLCGHPPPALPALPGRKYLNPLENDADAAAAAWNKAHPEEFAQMVADTNRCTELAALLGVSKQRAHQLLRARKSQPTGHRPKA